MSAPPSTSALESTLRGPHAPPAPMETSADSATASVFAPPPVNRTEWIASEEEKKKKKKQQEQKNPDDEKKPFDYKKETVQQTWMNFINSVPSTTSADALLALCCKSANDLNYCCGSITTVHCKGCTFSSSQHIRVGCEVLAEQKKLDLRTPHWFTAQTKDEFHAQVMKLDLNETAVKMVAEVQPAVKLEIKPEVKPEEVKANDKKANKPDTKVKEEEEKKATPKEKAKPKPRAKDGAGSKRKRTDKDDLPLDSEFFERRSQIFQLSSIQKLTKEHCPGSIKVREVLMSVVGGMAQSAQQIFERVFDAYGDWKDGTNGCEKKDIDEVLRDAVEEGVSDFIDTSTLLNNGDLYRAHAFEFRSAEKCRADLLARLTDTGMLTDSPISGSAGAPATVDPLSSEYITRFAEDHKGADIKSSSLLRAAYAQAFEINLKEAAASRKTPGRKPLWSRELYRYAGIASCLISSKFSELCPRAVPREKKEKKNKHKKQKRDPEEKEEEEEQPNDGESGDADADADADANAEPTLVDQSKSAPDDDATESESEVDGVTEVASSPATGPDTTDDNDEVM